MTTSIKVLAAASALTFTAIMPASADYTILQDSSLPSVLFVEFDEGEPKVISAPVMQIEPEESAAVSDPALPPIDGMSTDEAKSVEERVEEKIKALEDTVEVEMPAPVAMEETTMVDDPILKPTPAPVLESSDSDILSEAELR